MRSGITRRWLRGNLLITVLLVLLAEAMFLYSYTRSYYNSVQQTMYRRFSSVTGQLKVYTADTVYSAAANRSMALRRMVEQYSDKDKYEFMLLDSYGGVIASSSGTDADGIVNNLDFVQAQDAADGLGMAVYRTESGEVVMAACYLVPYAAEDVAALRLVTSLTLIERQIQNAFFASLVVVAAHPDLFHNVGPVFCAQHRGAAGAGGAHCRRHRPRRVRRAPAGERRCPGRGGPSARHHQPDGRRAGRDREDEERVHQFGLPRAAHAGGRHFRLRGGTAKGPPPGEAAEPVAAIQRESARMHKILSQLLLLTRGYEGRYHLEREVFPLREVVASVMEELAETAAASRIRLFNQVPEEVSLYADQSLTTQLLINLIGNSIRYGRERGKVVVRASLAQTQCTFTVSDDGIGIQEDQLPPTSLSGFTAAMSREMKRGSGVGLYVVQYIMERHHGTVKAENDNGLKIQLFFPLADIIGER